MSILGQNGKPITSDKSENTEKGAPNEAKGGESKKLDEPITEEEVREMAESYDKEVLAIVPAQFFIVYEKSKASGEQLPPKLVVRNVASSELHVIVHDLEKVVESDNFHAAVHVLSTSVALRNQLMAGANVQGLRRG